MECNTALLLMAGWSGLWLDGSDKYVEGRQGPPGRGRGPGRLTVNKAFVTAQNIDGLLGPWAGGTAAGPASVDLLSIDIDGNDYWMLGGDHRRAPARGDRRRYNAAYPPPVAFVAEYKADRVWDGGNYHSASLASLEALGRAKGYALVGCNLSGANAFFVREDELTGPDGQPRFAAPYTAANHYEPPR